MKPRKLGYYARSLTALWRGTEHVSLISTLARGRGRLRFHGGPVLRVPTRLDVLVAAETLLYDVYRLVDLHSPRLVIDVGASVGDVSLGVARRFPDCRVIAFEPDAGLFELLQENLALNRARNVTAHRSAVGTGASRLDELLRSENVDLLKVDCEGAELDVLRSMGSSAGCVKRIALEYHDFAGPGCRRAVTEHLVAHGFRPQISPDRYDSQIGYFYATRSK